MKRYPFALLVLGVIGLASCNRPTDRDATGPYGGDVVSLGAGLGQAELLANADTGEVVAHVWDNDLKTPRPIAGQPITVGSGDQTVLLDPHPLPTDPPGYCSRFYGRADWARGGGMHHGWIQAGTVRQDWTCRHCWSGGRQHGDMWSEMRGHGPGMHRGGMGGMGSGTGGMGGMGGGTPPQQGPN